MAKQAKRQLAGSGETLPAGAVGEIISASLSTGTATISGGATGVFTMANIVLTPGQWLILAEESAYNSTRGSAGSISAGGSDIFDGTSAIAEGAQSAVWYGTASSGDMEIFRAVHHVPYSVPAGTTKTISFRLKCNVNSGTPNGASCGNRGFGFLRAIRIA
jgi:hypothetical protein